MVKKTLRYSQLYRFEKYSTDVTKAVGDMRDVINSQLNNECMYICDNPNLTKSPLDNTKTYLWGLPEEGVVSIKTWSNPIDEEKYAREVKVEIMPPSNNVPLNLERFLKTHGFK